jgi:hypothetical protein
MKNGLYAVQFGAAGNMGAGVITYRDGKVTGGDSGYAYAGQVNDDNGSLSGTIDVFRHFPGFPSVFGNVERFTLTVTGAVTPGADRAGLDATTPGSPVPLKISMQLIRAD